MKTSTLFLTLGVLAIARHAATAAPSYSVDWDVATSGGGSSSGGTFAVWDVVGQADAGELSGGTFSLNSGQMSRPGLAGFQTRVVSGGRRIFYNGSSLDGASAAANASDDAALATDKSALLPGGTATFANVTSHPSGITGIMIDVEALPEALTEADIQVKAGNSQSPGSWTNVVSPTITLRRGAGSDGSDRVTLAWPGGVLQNQWLQATIKATPQSGIDSDDVFYFGSSIGDVGDSSSNFAVNSIDVTSTRLNVAFSQVPVTSPYDIDRDGRVNSTDVTLVRLNLSVVPSRALVRLVAP
ncbi:MAG: hypothetical protein WCR07_05535 [Verrucomicrobiota bacterium]|jgi:hypothetical protein